MRSGQATEDVGTEALVSLPLRISPARPSPDKRYPLRDCGGTRLDGILPLELAGARKGRQERTCLPVPSGEKSLCLLPGLTVA